MGHRTDEQGFTLTEVIVVVLLMLLVSGMLYPTLNTFLNHTASTQVRGHVLTETRGAVETIARDLRAANPIDALPSATPLSTYDRQVSFGVYCTTGADCPASKLRQVSYRVTGNRLERVTATGTRVLLGPMGYESAPVASRPGAIVNDVIFRYYKKDGTQIQTSGPAAPPSSVQFRDCAKAVEIDLVVRGGERRESDVTLRTRVDLRNWNEVSGC